MDNRYLGKVINEMTPFIEEQGFKTCETGEYKNEKKSVKVEYNEAKQQFVLLVADVDEEGKIGEFGEISAWLFDDSQTEKDAEAVGIDFVDTLRKNMGVKIAQKQNLQVDLPTATGDKFTISAFAKKVLDTYPQLKDEYKNYVAKYGSFLYLNFFGTYLVPLLKETLGEKTKKSGKKVLELIEPAYVKGDNDTSNVAIACLAAACYNDDKITEAVNNLLADNVNLKMSVVSFGNVLKTNKKLRNILVK
ncbi:MAG: hypothetical protein MJ080_05705 [Clostridia bacterium]|nr:hypothetical protein [Clostridia bacterium]